MSSRIIASVELGGTKTIVAVARDPLHPLADARFPTDMPARLLPRVLAQLRAWQDEHGAIAGLGIGSFGPVRLHRSADDWGCILATPKAGWAGAAVAPFLGAELGCPVAIDTDVNAAALAEQQWGAGRGCRNLAYVTVGTGIGGGLVLNGAPHHGALHPEIGHLLVRRHPEDSFAGTCPFHGDCLEGLASGPAIKARLGKQLDKLSADHPFRAILADYLAQLGMALLLSTAVERIIMGGGVLQNLNLLPSIQARLHTLLGGYIPMGEPTLLAAPELSDAGLMGGFILAQQALS